MKVVLDTNVLVSGIFFGGQPEKILNAWLQEKFAVYATPSILSEYLRVIIKMDRDGGNERALQWMASLSELFHLVPDSSGQKPISRDASDDKFLYCATHAQANYLITGDSDLKVLEDTYSFKIVSPKQFLEILKR